MHLKVEEHRWPLEAGKGKDVDSSLRANRENQPCQHLDFKSRETDFVLLSSRTVGE